jgi:flagellin
MSRINTNVPSVIAQANLARTQQELSLRLERLSTGLRINRGADDPAGLIIAERIRSDIQGADTGIKNSERASSVIATAEAALNEVNDLMNSIRSLIVEAANTGANSAEERKANQLQIDSAIDSITRISNTASFGGLKLLNGSLDYRLSGVAASAMNKVQVNGASFINNAAIQVQVDVTASAQRGGLYLRAEGMGGPPARTLSATTLEIAGPKGVQVITVASGSPIQSIIDAVNNLRSLTGVSAGSVAASGVSGVVFNSQEFGSDAFVSVRRIGGPSNPAQDYWAPRLVKFPAGNFAGLTTWTPLVTAQRDEGRDVTALVNGNLATGRGLKLSINSQSLSLEFELTEAAGVRPAATPQSFYITGGGALFQLGPEVNAAQQTNLGIPSMAASNLGNVVVNGVLQSLASLKSGQTNSIEESVRRGNDFSVTQDILAKAIDEVTVLRGRLGAFERNVLDTNTRSLQASFENLTASVSQIRDADFATETSRLTRAQILSSAGNSVLLLANQQSQQVLQLLGG